MCARIRLERTRGALGRAIAALVGIGPRFQRGVSLGVSQLLAGDRSIPGRSPDAARRPRFAKPKPAGAAPKRDRDFPGAVSRKNSAANRASALPPVRPASQRLAKRPQRTRSQDYSPIGREVKTRKAAQQSPWGCLIARDMKIAMQDDPPADRPNESGGSTPLIQVSATDVLGIGRGCEAVMKILQAGIGAAFEPLMRSWLARSDQAATKDWLKLSRRAGLLPSEMELTTLAGRAEMRLLSERERKQENRENIAFGVIEEARVLIAEGVVPNAKTSIEPEWLSRFWRLAEEITTEQLQSLWSRVAGSPLVFPRSARELWSCSAL
jgi:hypothetical protein